MLDHPSPLRMIIDRAYHAGVLIGRDLPDPLPASRHRSDRMPCKCCGPTRPRWRRYPFAPHGERSIAHAYRKVLARARSLIYVEDQYLWAPFVADLIADALRTRPELHVIAVVPRFPDKEGASRWPSLVGREQAIKVCRAAGGDRFAIYDVENPAGTAVYVHAKVVVVDDVWAMIGSDNLNRRSWTHDSELSWRGARRDTRRPRATGSGRARRPGPEVRPRAAPATLARASGPRRGRRRRCPRPRRGLRPDAPQR